MRSSTQLVRNRFSVVQLVAEATPAASEPPASTEHGAGGFTVLTDLPEVDVEIDRAYRDASPATVLPE